MIYRLSYEGSPTELVTFRYFVFSRSNMDVKVFNPVLKPAQDLRDP